jgi:hypothetical protein
MFSALVILLLAVPHRGPRVASTNPASHGARASMRPRLRMHWERDGENHLVSRWDRDAARAPSVV